MGLPLEGSAAGAVKSGRSAAMLAAAAFVVAAAGCWALSGRHAWVVMERSTMSTYFEADVARVYENMSDRWSDHYRSRVHPVFSIVAASPVYFFDRLVGMDRWRAVRLVQALVAGAWAAALSWLLFLVLPGALDAALFTAIGLASASSLLFFSVPETYGWGSVGILMALLAVAVAAERPVSDRWWVLTTAATLAMTVTNWMVGVLAAFTCLRWRRALRVVGAGFLLVLALSLLQLLLFNEAHLFVTKSDEAQFLRTAVGAAPLAALRSFFFHSVVMPAFAVAESGEWPHMTVEGSALGSSGGLGSLATVLWGALLALGAAALWRMKGHRNLRLVLAGSLVGQGVLHLLYGEETLLYALHYLPLLVVSVALASATRARVVVLVIAAALVPLLVVTNGRQFGEVTDFYWSRLSARELVADQMVRRPADPWPRGEGHVVVGFPDSTREDKAYLEPGGSFSPALGSFGVSFWVLDQDGGLVVTSDELPVSEIEQTFSRTQPGVPPAIHTRTKHYEATWSIDGEHRRVLRLSDTSGPDRTLALVIRSVGPAGAAVSELVRSRDGLLIDGRWQLDFDSDPAALELGTELGRWWRRAGSITSGRSSSETGWGFARWLVDEPDGELVMKIEEVPHSRDWAAVYPSSTLSISLPDPRFEESIRAYTDHLLMGLVEGDTRPGDPAHYPFGWLRDGAHVIAALARSGYLDRAERGLEELLESDFYGGFGAEADAPGAALWAMEEVAARRASTELDQRLWPHVRRKAELILEMKNATQIITKPFEGPLLGGVKRPRVVSFPARGGLINGRMDNHRPWFYVNANAYRGLRDAAGIAERLGKEPERRAWAQAASELEAAWIAAFEVDGGNNPRTYAAALWPYDIAARAEAALEARLEERWRERRGPEDTFDRTPDWPYFELAEAHQWLLVGRPDRCWQTLDWLLDHQASAGLFTFGEGRGEINNSGGWEEIRGWIDPPHVTPHYWAAAEALNLSLDMLAYARPDTLEIHVGAGVPESWLGEDFVVEGLSTRHGMVDWSWIEGRIEVRVRHTGSPPRVVVSEVFPGDADVRLEASPRVER